MFQIKERKKKEPCRYRTLYLSQNLIDQVCQLACLHKVSFNYIVVNMIEACLEQDCSSLQEEKDSLL